MKEEIRDILDHKIEKISKYQKGDKFVVEIMESGYPYSVIGERRNCSEEFLDSLDRLDGDYINEHFGELQDEAYNKGLNDAWRLAKQVSFEFSDKKMKEIFGTGWLRNVFDLAPQEALAKMKAYEESQEIKVGEIVSNGGVELLVTAICNDESRFDGIITTPTDKYGKLGATYSGIIKKNFTKTGKHIDIQQILNQIGE